MIVAFVAGVPAFRHEPGDEPEPMPIKSAKAAIPKGDVFGAIWFGAGLVFFAIVFVLCALGAMLSAPFHAVLRRR